ncbi:hypothetical protein GCM10023231_04270 [Olivibacter ginsenosidimutans]|uniref:SPOR domain-containing protein n=1 Tax=Olivibacter ginsenosidimutans TaxID=1176537 RepID=A0ABP9AGA5_9SPHI
MFSLGQYIHRLLLTHLQVGVPGIGIFSKRRLAATFDESSNCFLPPAHTYTLVLHAPTDSLLIDYVSKTHDLSAEEASRTVDTVVEQLLAKIAEQGEITLDELGYLKEEQGDYQLVPFDQPNTWGLQPVAERETMDVQPKESAVQVTEVIQATEVETVSEPDPFQTEETAKTNRRWLTIVLAAVAACIIIAFYIWNRQDKANTVHTPTTDTAIKSTTDTTTLHAEGQTTPAENTASAIPEDTALVRTITAPKVPYCIVIGSFKKLDLAIKQASYFRSIGIKAYVLESNIPNNRKKICIGSYASKEEAMKYLDEVREKITAEAYIYP